MDGIWLIKIMLAQAKRELIVQQIMPQTNQALRNSLTQYVALGVFVTYTKTTADTIAFMAFWHAMASARISQPGHVYVLMLIEFWNVSRDMNPQSKSTKSEWDLHTSKGENQKFHGLIVTAHNSDSHNSLTVNDLQ